MLPECTSFLSCCWPSCETSCLDTSPHVQLNAEWSNLTSLRQQSQGCLDGVRVLINWTIATIPLWQCCIGVSEIDIFEHFASDNYLSHGDNTMQCLLQTFEYMSLNACMFMTCLSKPYRLAKSVRHSTACASLLLDFFVTKPSADIHELYMYVQ